MARTSQTGADLPGLLWTLVRTDFKTRYHGTLGGYLWALLKPLSMFLVLLAVFSLIFTNDPAYSLNLIIGLFLWDFFSEATRSGVVSLHSKAFLLTKARFPSWIVVVSSCSNAFITLCLLAVVVCTAVHLLRRPLALAELALVAGYLLAFVVIVVGFSLAASVLFLRYRDLNQVWDLILQAGFFVAPVVYPLHIIPERYHRYLFAWLPTPVIVFCRMVLVEGRRPSLTGHLLLVAVAGAALAVGIAVFQRCHGRAIEEL